VAARSGRAGGPVPLVRAVEPVGVARGLTTLIQLLAAAPPSRAGEIRLPGTRILDAPRFAWRGLSLDVARRFFTVGAGLGPDDIIQYWFAGVVLAASVPPQVRAQLDADLALSRRDLETAAAAAVPVIVSPLSHCYLDVPYAEAPADPAQANRQGRLGLRLYAPTTVAESYQWEPADVLGPGREAQVAGVEAAIWAETISGFDDLSFLLLPRLPGVADKAWSVPQLASWAGYRDRLARHGRLWAQDELTYFRTTTVDWL
jgi:hexosaminidase